MAEKEITREFIEDSPDKRASFYVSIFGTGSETAEDLKAINNARLTAREMIEKGFSIATGGYGGVMKAATEAAISTLQSHGEKTQGRILAQTLESSDLAQREVSGANIVRSKSLPHRLGRLIDESSGYVVLRGKMGTIVELLVALEGERIRNLTEKEALTKPLVIIDESLNISDLLVSLAKKEKRFELPVIAENVYILNQEPQAAEIAGQIMENYYLANLGKEADQKSAQEFSKYNLGNFLKSTQNFEQGAGI